ncbi:hypothetical protein PRZ48_013312 [Zasmidium cellare]|uniref:BTB domain-containing protein n=1 Tax=Zasmidium cellare TaxID=395010 RepID=A0ABR0E458_ZASCE|nr:hypothetical protein PRZ48_013312 [Zasmidium cellare]
MEEAPGAAREIIRISEDGDVMFTFPSDNSKVLVSSVVLKMASPVFKTLLGPHFREGQTARSSSNPIEIPLPEDDPQATADLCRLLHHIPVPELDFESDMGRMIPCAVAVDKWDCSRALQRSFRAILLHALHHNINNYDYEKLGQLASVAYCLGNQQVFGAVFDKLMLHFAKPTQYLRMVSEVPSRILPAQFYCQSFLVFSATDSDESVLEERRNRARDGLSTGLQALASSCKLCHRSRAKSVMNTEYMRHIAMDEPLDSKFKRNVAMDKPATTWPPAWQPDEVSLEAALSHVRGLARYTSEFQDECRFCGRQSPVRVERADYKQLVRETTGLWGYLSLTCIRQECALFEDSLYCEDHYTEDL